MDQLTPEERFDSLWTRRVAARLAALGIYTDSAPCHEAVATSACPFQSGQYAVLMDSVATPPPAEPANDDRLPYWLCTDILASAHCSVSARMSPRHSFAVDASKVLTPGLGARILSAQRASEYGSPQYPRPLVECCDGATLAKAQECARELQEMIADVRSRNAAFSALRSQLARSRIVSAAVSSQEKMAL